MSSTAELAEDALRRIRRLPPIQRGNPVAVEFTEADGKAEQGKAPPIAQDNEIPFSEDTSPFGVFGRIRGTCSVLKPECISVFAASLVLQGKLYPMNHPAFQALYKRTTLEHPEWFDTFTVVEAFDKSLMLPGGRRLIMHMVENPHQIPDSPPEEVERALLRATALHPDAKVLYAEPVFGTAVREDALPVPMEEETFLAEANRRTKQAYELALASGFGYRTRVRLFAGLKAIFHVICRLPKRFWLAWKIAEERVGQAMLEVDNIASWSPEEAMTYYRTGRCPAIRPEHRLGKLAEMEEAYEQLAADAPQLDLAIFTAASVVAWQLRKIDPLLFIVLPGEDNQLRFIGHWFWQNEDGVKKLHLHV